MKNRTMNLCNTCNQAYPECNGHEVEFGEGKGNDNIISCDGYKLKTALNEGCCPNCGCETFSFREPCGKTICCRCFEGY